MECVSRINSHANQDFYPIISLDLQSITQIETHAELYWFTHSLQITDVYPQNLYVNIAWVVRINTSQAIWDATTLVWRHWNISKSANTHSYTTSHELCVRFTQKFQFAMYSCLKITSPKLISTIFINPGTFTNPGIGLVVFRANCLWVGFGQLLGLHNWRAVFAYIDVAIMTILVSISYWSKRYH